MSEWKEMELSKLIEFGNGKKRPDSKGDIPIYGGNGILDYSADFNYQDETIVIGRVGAYCGSVYYEENPIWVSDNALAAKAKKGNSPKFLYYFLKHANLNQYAGGSSHPLVTQTLLNSLEFEICVNEKEQVAISEVLSSLDAKIDLLHRQNQTLEQMAETLFRQWFVEEANEDWEVTKLKELVNIGIGRTPPRNESQWFSKLSDNFKWASIKDLGDSGIFVFDTSEYLTPEAVEKFNIPIIPPDTVLLSFKMTLGRVAITTENMLSNEAIAHFKFNEVTPFSKEFLYFYLKTYPYETLGSTSSIVTSINSGMIKDMDIQIPDDETLSKFEDHVIGYFDKIKFNQNQIRTLISLRNTLLPKLMSGEIRVRD